MLHCSIDAFKLFFLSIGVRRTSRCELAKLICAPGCWRWSKELVNTVVSMPMTCSWRSVTPHPLSARRCWRILGSPSCHSKRSEPIFCCRPWGTRWWSAPIQHLHFCTILLMQIRQLMESANKPPACISSSHPPTHIYVHTHMHAQGLICTLGGQLPVNGLLDALIFPPPPSSRPRPVSLFDLVGCYPAKPGRPFLRAHAHTQTHLSPRCRRQQHQHQSMRRALEETNSATW